MKHDFETLPEKMFRLFGKKTFRTGSFKFEYYGENYDIVSTEAGTIRYGARGYYLRAEDSTQFIITEVLHVRKRILNPVIIKISERERNFGVGR